MQYKRCMQAWVQHMLVLNTQLDLGGCAAYEMRESTLTKPHRW